MTKWQNPAWAASPAHATFASVDRRHPDLTKNQSPPAPRRSRRLKNDTRSLLRSRPLQGVLALVAGLQVVAVAGGKEAPQPERPRLMRQAVAIQMPAAVVKAPVKVAVEASKAGKPAAPKSAEAEELAAKYRQRGYDVSPSLALQIHAAAMANGIDPKVAFGLVRTESAFRSSATSPVGAVGLTQLMPATARWLRRGVTRSDLRNPEVNLSIGFRYLGGLIRKYDGDTALAFTAYNRGPGTVDRVLRRGGNPDNGYAGMVLDRGKRRRHRSAGLRTLGRRPPPGSPGGGFLRFRMESWGVARSIRSRLHPHSWGRHLSLSSRWRARSESRAGVSRMNTEQGRKRRSGGALRLLRFLRALRCSVFMRFVNPDPRIAFACARRRRRSDKGMVSRRSPRRCASDAWFRARPMEPPPTQIHAA